MQPFRPRFPDPKVYTQTYYYGLILLCLSHRFRALSNYFASSRNQRLTRLRSVYVHVGHACTL